MMTELIWKAFLGAGIATLVLKFAVKPEWNGGMIFFISFAGLILVMVLIIFFEGSGEE